VKEAAEVTFVATVRQLDPVAAVLFGSVARGDFTQHSDADVLVVFDRAETSNGPLGSPLAMAGR